MYQRICAIFCVLLFSLSASAQQQLPIPEESPRITPLVEAVHDVMPTVVNIGTERIIRVSDPFEGFFNDFFGAPIRYYKEAIPLGSGVLVDPAGLVLTNQHVVRRATRIQVRLFDGRVFDARAVSADATNDLALLCLTDVADEGPFSAIPFSAPGDLVLGETVVAIGNPFGLEHSVAAGVLSAKNRSLEEGGVTFNDILQTDAAINPGNSGGPLINLEGELIGINIAIRRFAEGIGFAIPLRRIEHVLAQWLVPARFSMGVCGLTPETIIRDSTLETVVGDIEPGTPADDSPLEIGDRILSANGTPIRRALDLSRILWPLQPGDTLTLESEERGSVSIVVGEMNTNLLLKRRLGLQVQELTGPLRKALGLPQDLEGLAISDVRPDSEFASYGVERGDILFRIADTDTRTLDDAMDAIRDVDPGSVLPVFLISMENVRGRLIARRFGVNVTVQ